MLVKPLGTAIAVMVVCHLHASKALAEVVSYNHPISGMNESGVTVGTYRDNQGVLHGELRDGGIVTDLFVPGSHGTAANGINNRGDVVGFSYEAGAFDRGFLYRSGTFEKIHVPGAYYTHPFGINDQGQVVGNYGGPTGAHAFLYDSGGYVTFGPVGLSASDINNNGVIVGEYGSHGALLRGDNIQFFDVPGDEVYVSAFIGINDFDAIVGNYMAPLVGGDGGTSAHGFLFMDGDFTKFLIHPRGNTEVGGITNSGVIFGAYGVNNSSYGFTATPPLPPVPSPEPSTWVLFAALAMGWVLTSNITPVQNGI